MPGHQRFAGVGVAGECPLQQSLGADAVDEGMVHFGVHADPVVREPFDQMHFPQRPMAVEQRAVQSGGDFYQRVQIPGFRERPTLYVVVEVDGTVHGPRQLGEPNSRAGRLRKVRWKFRSAAKVAYARRANSDPVLSIGSKTCSEPTCIGCSRDSAMRNRASTGEMKSMGSPS